MPRENDSLDRARREHHLAVERGDEPTAQLLERAIAEFESTLPTDEPPSVEEDAE